MKIAYDAKRFFHNRSGLGNYSRDLIRILSTYYPNNEYFLMAKNIGNLGLEELSLPNVFFEKISKGTMSRQRMMGKDAQLLEADIFHGLSGELPINWDPSKPIKKVVSIHDLIFMRYPQYYSYFDRKIHLWKFRKAVEIADLVIAISEQTKRDIIKYLKVSEDKIRVVYQGCHQAFKNKHTNSEIQEVRDKFKLPNQFILNVGTIETRKNLLSILKAIKGTEIPLVVIGKKTSYYRKIERYIIRNKMESQVHFLQHTSMEEMAIIYHLADIFVYPSVFEGFGIPVIEALYSGTAVITSSVSSLPEAGGKDSMYVNPLNYKDLKSKIEFLWNNEEERNRRVEKSLKFVQKFNDEVIANNLMKVYEELMS